MPPPTVVALVSDTHGVWDPALASHFAGAAAIIHAGDVGHHGGAAAVLACLRALGPPLTAIRGNVDEGDPSAADLPETALLELGGWRLLVAHAQSAAVAAAAAEQHRPDILICGHSHKYLVEEQQLEAGPGAAAGGGRRLLVVNPGSAGPARFKLARSAALLTLPDKGGLGAARRGRQWLLNGHDAAAAPTLVTAAACVLLQSQSQQRAPPRTACAGSGELPAVHRIELAPKAPPRLTAGQQQQRQQGRGAKQRPQEQQQRKQQKQQPRKRRRAAADGSD